MPVLSQILFAGRFPFSNWSVVAYNAVLVSAVKQSKSALCIHTSPFFGVCFSRRSPWSTRQPPLCCAHVLIRCLFHAPRVWGTSQGAPAQSVYVSAPASFHHAPPPRLRVHINLSSVSGSLFLAQEAEGSLCCRDLDGSQVGRFRLKPSSSASDLHIVCCSALHYTWERKTLKGGRKGQFY